MPVGVQIRTSLRTGPTNPTGPESGAWFVAGVTAGGPVDGEIAPVHNITEYEQAWGPRTNASGLLYDQAMTFFAEGGGALYVGRAVGAAAESATIEIPNVEAVPEPTLSLTSKQPGEFSNSRLTATVAVAGGVITLKVLWDGAVREVYSGKTTVAALVAAMQSSRLVAAEALGAAVAASLPAAGVYELVGGEDDLATVDLPVILAALNRFGEEYGPGAVSIPGYDAGAVASGLVAHCALTYRVAITAGAQGSSFAEYEALAGSAAALAEWGGVFAPWVVIPDGSATRTISPEGYIAGVRGRAFSLEDEFWQVPAGQRATARFVRGAEIAYTLDDINTLADLYKVSGIITRRGATYLYQYRSLSVDEQQWELLQSRDTINAITARLSTALEPYVWAVIDGKRQLESQVLGAMIGVLQPISDAGGLYSESDPDGNPIHDGYTVAATSTPDQLGHNTIAATAAVKLSPFAGLIEIELVKASFTAPLV